VTSFAQDMGVDHRRADVFGEDNQRLSFTVLQCQASFKWREDRKLFFSLKRMIIQK
jgi:hypothetical protein